MPKECHPICTDGYRQRETVISLKRIKLIADNFVIMGWECPVGKWDDGWKVSRCGNGGWVCIVWGTEEQAHTIEELAKEGYIVA